MDLKALNCGLACCCDIVVVSRSFFCRYMLNIKVDRRRTNRRADSFCKRHHTVAHTAQEILMKTKLRIAHAMLTHVVKCNTTRVSWTIMLFNSLLMFTLIRNKPKQAHPMPHFGIVHTCTICTCIYSQASRHSYRITAICLAIEI